MRISDWSSDVCSSDLLATHAAPALKPGDGVLHPVRIIAFWIILVHVGAAAFLAVDCALNCALGLTDQIVEFERFDQICIPDQRLVGNIYILHAGIDFIHFFDALRSEEHTSELQSLMRISYAVFCLKKKKQTSLQCDTIELSRTSRRTQTSVSTITQMKT